MLKLVFKDKNKYVLINLITFGILMFLSLFLVALLKDSAINVIVKVYQKLLTNPGLLTLVIISSLLLISYLVYKFTRKDLIIDGLVTYLTFVGYSFIFYFPKTFILYLNKLGNDEVFFRKKLILVLALIALFIFTVYTIYLIALEVLKIIKKVAVNFQAPIINGDELKTTVGLYYLDFEYDENLTYEVIYESSYGIKEEKLKYRNLLTQVGNLLPDVEYEIHLYAYGKIKKKFCRVEANKVIKFTLQNKASELQRMIANYEVSNSQLVDCYIETLQVFDKMYKRMLIHAPEVHIIESLNKRILFAKMILLRDSIVVRFNFNPYLLEDNSKIINAFEEDCLLPSKYIIESLDDVYYMHKLVETMKNMKSKIE